MANEDTPSEEELERLRNKKELMELRHQIAELRAPWWRRASMIATVAAMGAAILPVTTAIQEHYRSEREFVLQQSKQDGELALARTKQQTDLALNQSRQENDIRMAYLDRFEHPGRRLQTLRFLLATSTDQKLLAWAEEEQKLVQGLIDQIEKDLAVVKKQIDLSQPGTAREELKKEHDRLSNLKDMTGRKPAPSKTGQE